MISESSFGACNAMRDVYRLVAAAYGFTQFDAENRLRNWQALREGKTVEEAIGPFIDLLVEIRTNAMVSKIDA